MPGERVTFEIGYEGRRMVARTVADAGHSLASVEIFPAAGMFGHLAKTRIHRPHGSSEHVLFVDCCLAILVQQEDASVSMSTCGCVSLSARQCVIRQCVGASMRQRQLRLSQLCFAADPTSRSLAPH